MNVNNITYEALTKANATIKTTNIKGKDYAEVNQRIKAFRMVYPTGSIITDLLSDDNGRCVFRAEVSVTDDEGKKHILGTGTAYEKENSSYINKTSYLENCVPLDTQILTNKGWKYYYQLGDEKALSLNMSTGKMEFCDILKINTYKDKPIVRMKTSRFDVKCTPQHKWLCKSQHKQLHKVATEDLTTSLKIVQAVKQDVDPYKTGKMLGWLMCDCEVTKTVSGMASTAYIRQSKHVDEVTALFGEYKGKKRKKYNDRWMDSYEWCIDAETVRNILGSFGMADYRDLPEAMAKADIRYVAGCYESMILADGTEGSFDSTYPELIDAMQIMCARLGIATTFVTCRMLKNSTKPLYSLGIKKTDGAWVSEIETTKLPPCDVWCPTTENGTWVMKQGSFVTLTSNCETSAIGRALGMAGFGIDTSVASYEEVANAMSNQANAGQNRGNARQAASKPKQQNELGFATPEQVAILEKVYKGDNMKKLLEINKVPHVSRLTFDKANELLSLLNMEVKA